MKLSNFLTIRLSALFLIILLIWSVIYFFMQMREIYDGIDEGLLNLKQEFIVKANDNADFLIAMQEHNPINMIVEEISYEEAIATEEKHITTKIYFETEKEHEEVRLLQTAFKCDANGKFYKLQFFTSTVETDDLIENMLTLLIVLWITLGLLLTIAGRVIINKSSQPFKTLLNRLQKFNLNRTEMIELPKTNITEFKILNSTIKGLLEENIQAYKEQKNFIENASHELQTPLAVVISKIELLINDSSLNEVQIKELSSILSNLNRMKRLNNSLLLLSKIRNKQFTDTQKINFEDIVNDVCDNFIDLIEHKGLSLNIDISASPTLLMNDDLAHIMINNLMKNAINYNISNGTIDIILTDKFFKISNDGTQIEEGINIFERYTTFSTQRSSNGLGLAIVTSIASLYNFKTEYSYARGKHNIAILF